MWRMLWIAPTARQERQATRGQSTWRTALRGSAKGWLWCECPPSSSQHQAETAPPASCSPATVDGLWQRAPFLERRRPIARQALCEAQRGAGPAGSDAAAPLSMEMPPGSTGARGNGGDSPAPEAQTAPLSAIGQGKCVVTATEALPKAATTKKHSIRLAFPPASRRPAAAQLESDCLGSSHPPQSSLRCPTCSGKDCKGVHLRARAQQTFRPWPAARSPQLVPSRALGTEARALLRPCAKKNVLRPPAMCFSIGGSRPASAVPSCGAAHAALALGSTCRSRAARHCPRQTPMQTRRRALASRSMAPPWPEQRAVTAKAPGSQEDGP
mmetsp:Transcript_18429/g.69787  ORF Transcript_18429/g.69787 Transcript_18429/m.69787 type:complete len:327 (+) Transcript_18429:739-1719(+)